MFWTRIIRDVKNLSISRVYGSRSSSLSSIYYERANPSLLAMYNADKLNHTCSNRFPALITGEKRESGVAKFWQQQAMLTVFLCLLQSISPTDPMTGHSQGHNFDDLRRNKRLHDPNTPKYPCLKRHFCISLQLPHQFRHSYWYGG